MLLLLVLLVLLLLHTIGLLQERLWLLQIAAAAAIIWQCVPMPGYSWTTSRQLAKVVLCTASAAKPHKLREIILMNHPAAGYSQAQERSGGQ
jgi:uncharacterized membrane protein